MPRRAPLTGPRGEVRKLTTHDLKGFRRASSLPQSLQQKLVLALPIQTRSLVLRHFVLEDAGPILLLNAEASTRRWLPSHVYADLPAAKDAMAFLIACCAEPGHPRLAPYVLAVEHAGTGQLLGHVGFSPLDDEVEVSYAIAESQRGHGYGAEALSCACDRVSQAFGLPGFIAHTAAENIASRRLLERTSFLHKRDVSRRFQGVEQRVSCYVWRAL